MRGVRVVVLAPAAVQLAACATWSARPGDPREVIEAEGSRGVRVLRASGDRVTVWDPQVVTNQVVGSTGSAPVMVPLGDIREVEVREIDRLRTGFVVGLLAGAVAAVVSVIAYSGA